MGDKIVNITVCTLIVVVNELSMNKDLFEKNMKSSGVRYRIYYSDKNLGYLCGMLFGYKKYVAEHFAPDIWFVLSNTDIVYPDINFFSNFLDNQYTNDTICVAPSVFTKNRGTYENPQYIRRHSLKSIRRNIRIFSRPYLAYFHSKASFVKARFLRSKKKESQFVYSVHGCYMFAKSSLMDALTKIEYRALMYSEEAFIAETVSKMKKRSYYDSSLEIVHMESTVTGLLSIKRKSGYYVASLQDLIREFYSDKEVTCK